jgi:LmbE family N-acetylglucosaminyl deacetylase
LSIFRRLRSQKSTIVKVPDRERLATRRRRRRIAGAIFLVLLLMLAPLMWTQARQYRRDLAMLEQTFPAGPTWNARDRLLIFSPHCDDETLGAGGAIAQARRAGALVRVVFFTNGDGSGSTKIGETVRHRRSFSYPELAQMRQREVVAAMKQVGVDKSEIIFLGYPDSGLRPMWQRFWDKSTLFRSSYTGATQSPYANSYTLQAPYCGAQVQADVTKILLDFRPTAVMTTHSADTHPDHWAAYGYTAAALETARLRGETWARQTRFLSFLVHHHIWPVPHGYHPQSALAPPAGLKNTGTAWLQTPLDDQTRAQKKAALEAYVSQLVFTPHYLRAFVRRNELFGRVPTHNVAPKVLSSGQSLPITLIQDETRDFLMQNVQPGGDILALSATPEAQRLSLKVHLAAQPSARLTYRLSLHQITSRVVQGQVLQWSVQNGVAAATLDGQVLRSRMLAQGFEVELPWKLLTTKEEVSWLVSVAVDWGSSRLDQTETAILRVRR